MAHGQVQVGIGQGNSGIFGIEPQNCPQSVAVGVQLLELVGALTGSDKRKNRNPPRGHDVADGFAALAKQNVYHPGREAVSKRLKQRSNQQNSVLGGLKNHRIAHEQGREEGSKGLVQGVVVGPHDQGHSQGNTPHLGHKAGIFAKAHGVAVHFFDVLNGIAQVVHRAVKFFGGIGLGLADLPHEQVDHLGSHREHRLNKGFCGGYPLRG